MSGLLPRTQPTSGTGSFTNLNVQSLNVSAAAFINDLVANSASISNINIGTVTVSTINGAPNVNIVAGVVSVDGDTVTTNTSTQTLTNKTIDSASNTITITNSPLTTVNINSLINQDVRTTSSPTFSVLTIDNQLYVNTNGDDGILLNTITSSFSNELSVTHGDIKQVGFGNNDIDAESYVWVYVNQPLKIATNDTERIRILGSGIGNDNSVSNILALNGTTLVYKNNIADTSTAQTLTNKTIDSASNTITITNSPLTAVNVNSLINQDVRTTAAPSFTGSLTLTQSSNSAFTITGKADLGYSNVGGAWFGNASAGDVNLRNQDNTKKLNLGLGSGTSQISITNSTTTINSSFALGSVSNNNAITNILGLNGTSVVYKNNIVDTSSTQTLTNKTIDSASNTITITNSPLSAINVNSLIDQDVRTTSTPTFSGATIATNGLSVTGTKNVSHTPAGVYCGVDIGGASTGIEIVNTGNTYVDFTTPGVDSLGRIAYIVSSNSIEMYTNGTLGLSVDGSQVTKFNSDQIRIINSKTPSSSSDTGTTGSFCYDSDYLYICVGTNSWKRAAVTNLLW